VDTGSDHLLLLWSAQMATQTPRRFFCRHHWTPAERLAYQTDRSGGPSACWPWLGAKATNGYGKVQIAKNTGTTAHRATWEVNYGPIPPDMVVCHHCDNKWCVNPLHLFCDTQAGNVADRDAKGRQIRGVTHHKSKLTEADVRAIRKAKGTQRAIAAQYGISFSTVDRIKRGIIWKHLR
jgi:hypothetical protein